MKFRLKYNREQTLIPAELLEIYQPILGFEAIAVWINIYHVLVNGHSITEADLIQQLSISQRVFRSAITELETFKLVETNEDGEVLLLMPLSPQQLQQALNGGMLPEHQRRLNTLVECYLSKRGRVAIQSKEPAAEKEEQSTDLSEQQLDEFATRFIKECEFIPNKQLRERFDIWFEEINDYRLLDELLERTKRKVQKEGNKGTCPSVYADKIVRQWLIKGIRTYDQLMRHDQEFQARWEYYRIVEKELGRSYNSLTPAEKEIVDQWIALVDSNQQMTATIKKAILSGKYQGRGAPSIAFIDDWFRSAEDKPKSKRVRTKSSPAFTHSHELSDLQKVIQRKTMVGLEANENEG